MPVASAVDRSAPAGSVRRAFPTEGALHGTAFLVSACLRKCFYLGRYNATRTCDKVRSDAKRPPLDTAVSVVDAYIRRLRAWSMDVKRDDDSLNAKKQPSTHVSVFSLVESNRLRLRYRHTATPMFTIHGCPTPCCVPVRGCAWVW